MQVLKLSDNYSEILSTPPAFSNNSNPFFEKIKLYP